MIIRFDRHSADRHNEAMNRGLTALRAALNVRSYFQTAMPLPDHHRDVAVPHRQVGGQQRLRKAVVDCGVSVSYFSSSGLLSARSALRTTLRRNSYWAVTS